PRGAHARQGHRGARLARPDGGARGRARRGRGDEDGERAARAAGGHRQVGGRETGRHGRAGPRARGARVTDLPRGVTLVEVGPRDGLQNEAAKLSVDDRVEFCDRLLDAGLPVVETGAFVSPKWVPQMAGSDEVFRRVKPRGGARRVVLVPNRQGYERAREAGCREIAVFTAASETFTKKNINATIDESFDRFREFVPEARREGLWVRASVSTCLVC